MPLAYLLAGETVPGVLQLRKDVDPVSQLIICP